MHQLCRVQYPRKVLQIKTKLMFECQNTVLKGNKQHAEWEFMNKILKNHGQHLKSQKKKRKWCKRNRKAISPFDFEGKYLLISLFISFFLPWVWRENGPSVYNRSYDNDYKSSHRKVIYALWMEAKLYSWHRLDVSVLSSMWYGQDVDVVKVYNEATKIKWKPKPNKWKSEEIQTNIFWFLSPTTLQIFLNAKNRNSSVIARR